MKLKIVARNKESLYAVDQCRSLNSLWVLKNLHHITLNEEIGHWPVRPNYHSKFVNNKEIFPA